MKASILFATMTLYASSCLNAQPAVEAPLAITYTKQWQASANSSGKGLILTETSPAGVVNRYLVVTPQGSRISVTYRYVPREGYFRYSVMDATTGWRATVEKISDLRLKDMNEVADQSIFIPKLMARDYSQSLTLSTPTTARAEFRGSLHAEDFVTAAVTDFARRAILPEIAATVPPGVVDGLAFLEAIAGSEHEIPSTGILREAIGVFIAVLERGGADLPTEYKEQQWSGETLEAYTGPVLAGAQAEFAKSFLGVGPEDPLAGEHLPGDSAERVPPP